MFPRRAPGIIGGGARSVGELLVVGEFVLFLGRRSAVLGFWILGMRRFFAAALHELSLNVVGRILEELLFVSRMSPMVLVIDVIIVWLCAKEKLIWTECSGKMRGEIKRRKREQNNTTSPNEASQPRRAKNNEAKKPEGQNDEDENSETRNDEDKNSENSEAQNDEDENSETKNDEDKNRENSEAQNSEGKKRESSEEENDEQEKSRPREHGHA